MQIRITKKTDVEDKGKYKMATVFYSQDGQDKEKKVMSFAQKETYATLVNAAPGEVYDIKAVKDGKFWNWESATAASGVGVPSTGSSTAAKGNWETAEERAMRQVWIIRQSSIAAACQLYARSEPGLDRVKMVLDAAKHFEAYVHGVNETDEPEID